MNGDMAVKIDEALALLGRSENEPALEIAQTVLAGDPTNVPAMFVVGLVAGRMEELGLALKVLDEAHRIDPDVREIIVLLAYFSAFAGRLKDSLYYSKLAIATPPSALLASHLPVDFADVGQAIQSIGLPNYVIDATIAMHLQEWEKAERLCRRELGINPDNGAAWCVMAKVLAGKGNLVRAAAAARAAIASLPGAVEPRVLLGDLLSRDGRYYEALECFRAAIAIDPASRSATAQLLAALERFPSEFAAVRDAELALFKASLPKSNTERPKVGNGRLRVGYLVSEHAAETYARILAPLWAAHDTDRVDLFVFQQFMSSDLPLGRHRGDVAHWREVRGLDDETLAHVIRGEGIDILIDLCGLTQFNRAVTLADAPAPVVLGWLAPGVAELGDIYDAVLADQWSAVPGAVRYVEIPGGCQSLEAGVIASALARRLTVPAEINGYLTFGACLNVGDIVPAMRHWAALLAAFPNSLLFLGDVPTIGNDTAERLVELAGQFGCAHRLRFQETVANALPEEVFWSSIDILLEPPHAHNPGRVADALAVGVPVVTWRGGRHSSTIGASQLGMVGRSEWCAEDPSELPQLVEKIAPSIPALVALRAELTAGAAASRLFDVPAFAAELERVLFELAAGR